jgi:hypothetical protein
MPLINTKGTYSTPIRGGGVVAKAPVTAQNIKLAKANVTPMKSVFSNNTVHYKKGSSGVGIGGVSNHRSRGKKT